MITFQELLRRLSLFWQEQGCLIHQGYDLEVGAGTFNPSTFLRCLGPEPYKAGYIEPCRRPTDGRYGENPNRVQHYFQYQVVLKPSPLNIQQIYLDSLEAVGFDLSKHDIRFVHDDWESPTLGAWGLGWEVWMDGMEVTQFTYFQSVAGIACKPVTGEITYGLERLALFLQGVDSFFDMQWDDTYTYGDIYHKNEVEWSGYNFEHASTEMWFRHFDDYEKEAKRLIELGLPIPAYDFVMKASHAFNLLDARGAISVTERNRYIGRIRDIACLVAESYIQSREKLGYPLLKHLEKSTIPEAPALSTTLTSAKPEEREDFLLEVGSEELPASIVERGACSLKEQIQKLLEEEEIPFNDIRWFGTPRRLSVMIDGLAMAKPAQQEERRGPAIERAFGEDGQPTKAGEGFFRGVGAEGASLQQIQGGHPSLTIREVKGTNYLFATFEKPGVSTAALLAEKLPQIILKTDFPKTMRWADLDISYARPIRWIVALFGDEVIPFVVGNVIADRQSRGHKQRARGSFPIDHAGSYLKTLRQHKVMADPAERKQTIEEQLATIESETGATIIEHDAVMPQVIHLTEWPELVLGEFNPSFLKVPKEVLTSEMVEHQKYFPLANDDGTLCNNFVITADMPPSDEIRRGNEKVLSARLSDGAFLYEKDLKVPLEKFNEKLSHVTYLKGLGSLADKVKRLEKHVEVLHSHLKMGSLDHAQRAAELSKADLTSDMVYEFPDLQGIIGRTYAEAHGEPEEVAIAIEEQWMPLGENAPLPKTPTGVLLSLADKIDTLLSCFALGLRPSSSGDPYALRRQVLGIIRILIAGKLHLPLMETFRTCLQHFPKDLVKDPEELLSALQSFFANRIKTVFQHYDLSRDEVEASISFGYTDIYDTYRRVQALHDLRQTGSAFTQLYEVYKRAKGQLDGHHAKEFKPTLLSEPAEKALDEALNTTQNPFSEAMATQNYDTAYALIVETQPQLAALFDHVKILADDTQLRDNRIALLQRVFDRFEQLLDFSKIQDN